MAKLSEYTKINDHSPIDLIDNKQLSYDPIYSLKPVELKTLKIYIKTNLANDSIRSFKSPVGTPMVFIYKKKDNFWLYVNY